MSEVLRAGNELRIGMIGAGTMAGAHSAALANLPHLYPGLARRPHLVAVADVNLALASALAGRFGYERVADDAAAIPPLFLPGVLLDAALAVGRDTLPAEYGITPENLAKAEEAMRSAVDYGGAWGNIARLK